MYQRNIVRIIGSSLIALIVASFPLSANADAGVIVLMTRKCFIINANSGYVIVDVWLSGNVGDTVIGDFNTYGSTKIFNTIGTNVTGYIYIEDFGLSKSRLQDKWNDKYREKCE